MQSLQLDLLGGDGQEVGDKESRAVLHSIIEQVLISHIYFQHRRLPPDRSRDSLAPETTFPELETEDGPPPLIPPLPYANELHR